MMLRLVLVGVVAALGVSVPSQPSCEHWFESAQAWTTSLLAEWDTWEPEVEDGPRLVGTPNAIGCEECRLARMRLLASAPETSKAEVIVAAGNGTSNVPDKGPGLPIPRPVSRVPKRIIQPVPKWSVSMKSSSGSSCLR